jgi:hypothetical protein
MTPVNSLAQFDNEQKVDLPPGARADGSSYITSSIPDMSVIEPAKRLERGNRLATDSHRLQPSIPTTNKDSTR